MVGSCCSITALMIKTANRNKRGAPINNSTKHHGPSNATHKINPAEEATNTHKVSVHLSTYRSCKCISSIHNHKLLHSRFKMPFTYNVLALPRQPNIVHKHSYISMRCGQACAHSNTQVHTKTYVCVRSFHTEPATRVREKCKADNAKQTKHPSSASNRREAEESEEVATKSKTAKIAPEDE